MFIRKTHIAIIYISAALLFCVVSAQSENAQYKSRTDLQKLSVDYERLLGSDDDEVPEKHHSHHSADHHHEDAGGSGGGGSSGGGGGSSGGSSGGGSSGGGGGGGSGGGSSSGGKSGGGGSHASASSHVEAPHSKSHPGLLLAGAAAAGAVYAAISYKNKVRVVDEDSPHPLAGSVGKRIALFSNLAGVGGEASRPARVIDLPRVDSEGLGSNYSAMV